MVACFCHTEWTLGLNQNDADQGHIVVELLQNDLLVDWMGGVEEGWE